MLKYREPPLTLEKTSRLITFLHYLLKVIPINNNNKNTAMLFPLGIFIEDITPTLSTTPQQQSSWIIIIQFMLSCFRSCPQQYIYNSGVTTPILLIIVKQVLLELAKLPPTKDMKPIQEKCFLVGKELLDLLLIRDTALTDEILENSNTLTPNFVGLGTLSYYDVIYSVSCNRCNDKLHENNFFFSLFLVS